MSRALAILLLLALAGCAAPQRLTGSGVPAEPPVGYLIDCAQNPDQEHCR